MGSETDGGGTNLAVDPAPVEKPLSRIGGDRSLGVVTLGNSTRQEVRQDWRVGSRRRGVGYAMGVVC